MVQMKHRPGPFTVVAPVIWCMALMLASFTGWCQEQTKQRILIITGGHAFEREAFFNIFGDMTDVGYKEVVQPYANQIYDTELMDQYDILLFYDMVQEINDHQKKAFVDLLNEGKGVVFLNHSLVSYQGWDEFEKIIGGRYVLSGPEQDSSTYRHDVELPVEVIDRHHPITKGVDDFVIHDEVYGNFKVLPTVHPLLGTRHPESGDVIGWTNLYGKSRIVYIQLGHDHFAYENPDFRRIIRQSIQWVQNQ
jgi:type 1 glutamine amidotransferase